jgi:hypothetical protein
MKKVILVLGLFIISSMSYAKDIKINVSNLPTGITSFVSKYYHSTKITAVFQESDDKDYNLTLSDGTRLEFNQQSEWTEIKTKSTIPAGIIPQGLLKYVNETYPGKTVKNIERCKAGYDIKLNGNKRFQLDSQFKPSKFKKSND